MHRRPSTYKCYKIEGYYALSIYAVSTWYNFSIRRKKINLRNRKMYLSQFCQNITNVKYLKSWYLWELVWKKLWCHHGESIGQRVSPMYTRGEGPALYIWHWIVQVTLQFVRLSLSCYDLFIIPFCDTMQFDPNVPLQDCSPLIAYWGKVTCGGETFYLRKMTGYRALYSLWQCHNNIVLKPICFWSLLKTG